MNTDTFSQIVDLQNTLHEWETTTFLIDLVAYNNVGGCEELVEPFDLATSIGQGKRGRNERTERRYLPQDIKGWTTESRALVSTYINKAAKDSSIQLFSDPESRNKEIRFRCKRGKLKQDYESEVSGCSIQIFEYFNMPLFQYSNIRH